MGARGWGFVVGCAETGAAYGGPVEPVEHGIVNGLVAWTEALHGLADCAEGWEGGRSVGAIAVVCLVVVRVASAKVVGAHAQTAIYAPVIVGIALPHSLPLLMLLWVDGSVDGHQARWRKRWRCEVGVSVAYRHGI